MVAPVKVIDQWLYQLALLADALHLSIYLFMSTYVWPLSGSFWCTFPKIAILLSYLILEHDKLYSILAVFVVTVPCNILTFYVIEETMVGFH